MGFLRNRADKQIDTDRNATSSLEIIKAIKQQHARQHCINKCYVEIHPRHIIYANHDDEYVVYWLAYTN